MDCIRESFTIPVAARAVDQVIKVCDQPFRLVLAQFRWGTAGGGGAEVQLRKVPSGTAIASGTALLSAAINLTATADTRVLGTIVPAARDIPAGNAIAVDFGGTVTPLAALVITLVLERRAGEA